MVAKVDITDVLYRINEDAADFYQNYLHEQEPKEAWQYLYKRGIERSFSAIAFKIGASSSRMDDLYKHLKAEGFSDRDLLTSGLICKSRKGKYYDRFRNRIMFPICNIAGQVIGFIGRLYKEIDMEAKFLYSRETAIFKKQDNLYGLNVAAQRCHDSLILVEGIMDAIALNQAGFSNVAALLGLKLTEEQVKLISQHTKELVICFDGDEAGIANTRKALDTAAKGGLKVRAVTLPDRTDPAMFVLSYGFGGFFYLISSAQTPLSYLLSMAEKERLIKDDESLVNYLQTAAQILAKEESALAVDVHASAISKKYGVSKDIMLAEVKRYRRKFKKESDNEK